MKKRGGDHGIEFKRYLQRLVLPLAVPPATAIHKGFMFIRLEILIN